MRSKKLWLYTAAFAAILGWPWVTGTPYMLTLASGAAIWGLFALSYDLIIGWTGEVSFGHALYFGLGVYTTGLLIIYTHVPTVLAMAGGVLATAMAAWALNSLSLRVTGPYFAMVTFALAEFFHLAAQSATSVTGGSNGLVGMPLASWLTQPGVLYDISAALALLAASCLVWVKSTRTGHLVHAVRDNPLRAEMLGIRTHRAKVLTLTVSGALAGLAGSLYLLYEGMAFTGTLNSNTSFTVLLMVIIGGVDSVWGPLIAGGAVYIAQTWLNATTTHWELILGVIYIGVVRFFPQGLSGLRWIRPEVRPQDAADTMSAHQGGKAE